MDLEFQKQQENKISERLENKVAIVIKPQYKEYQRFGR